MEEYNKFELFYRTRESCIVRVPKHIKNKKKIKEYIINKIIDNELDSIIDCTFDYEIEEFLLDDEISELD